LVALESEEEEWDDIEDGLSEGDKAEDETTFSTAGFIPRLG